MVVYVLAASSVLPDGNPPSPYANDMQTFYESGGEGLKAPNQLRLKNSHLS